MTTTTQTCNKCRKNKPLNMFHRKGAGYQRTCKQCRNQIEASRYSTQGKTPLPRNISPINKDNFAQMQARIVALEPRLRAKAAAFACDPQDADDVYSEMVEAILTKSQPEESDFYLLQRANWTAQNHIQKTQTYSQYVDNIDIDESEATQAGFKIVTNPRVIEDAMIQSEDMNALSAVIKSLPEENQQIVALLSLGKNQRQIAAELKVTEQKISDTMKSIRTTLKLSFA